MSDKQRSEAESAVLMGDHLARQGDVGSARGAFQSAIAYNDPEWWPCAAYRGALEYRHPEIGPRAAVNLGFMLFTELGQVEEAEAAFRVALEGSDPEQAQLARQNLAAMRQLDADRRHGRRHVGVEDATDLSVGRGKGSQRWTRWVGRDRS